MLPAKYFTALWGSIGVVLLLTLSACGLTLAYNGTSGVPANSVNPASPTSTPDVPATVEALVQLRLSELLPANTQPIAEAVQSPPLATGTDRSSAYYRSGFACTGSMRPTIDCGDEGVFLRPPFSEPLKVGDIISFSSDVGCRYYKDQKISKAHRIISIREEGTVTLYTTQGDATNDADPCETTLDQIDGKLVEIHKGTRPQDVIDTTEYDLAKERVSSLKEEYDTLLDQFKQNKFEYDESGKEYQRLISSYTEGTTEHKVVAEYYQQLEAERIALNQQKDRLNDLAQEVNTGIDEIDRLYRELFIK